MKILVTHYPAKESSALTGLYYYGLVVARIRAVAIGRSVDCKTLDPCGLVSMSSAAWTTTIWLESGLPSD